MKGYRTGTVTIKPLESKFYRIELPQDQTNKQETVKEERLRNLETLRKQIKNS
jgi:hypothetical protein